MNPCRICPSPVAAALLVALAAAGHLPATAADDAERSRIAEERAAIEARYAARERECSERFVVTACVDEAKVERRHALDVLRSRQLQLDEARRHERTAERRAELAAKAADDARREQERAARAASAPAQREASRPLEPRHEPAAASAPAASGARRDRPGATGEAVAPKVRPSKGSALRDEREASRRASYETRQRQAAEHRQEVLDRAAKRLKDHPAAAPLPLPASAATR